MRAPGPPPAKRGSKRFLLGLYTRQRQSDHWKGLEAELLEEVLYASGLLLGPPARLVEEPELERDKPGSSANQQGTHAEDVVTAGASARGAG
jgi:hypothetical protein